MYENYKKKKIKLFWKHMKAWSLTEVAEQYFDTKSFLLFKAGFISADKISYLH